MPWWRNLPHYVKATWLLYTFYYFLIIVGMSTLGWLSGRFAEFVNRRFISKGRIVVH